MKILIVIVTVTDFSLESLNTIVCLWFFLNQLTIRTLQMN